MKKKKEKKRRRREKVNETSNRFQIPNTPLLCFLCFLRNQTGLRERNSNKKGNPKQKITTNHARHSLQQFKYHFLETPRRRKIKSSSLKKKKLHRKKQQSYEFEHIRYTYIHIYMQRERERKGKLTGLKVFFISSFCCFAFWENQKHAQKVFVQIMREREREERERVRLLKLQKRRKGREV